jgi:myo-inositol 2-dehydrogenase/D-chiro-inositol 1-dehydrogenase
MKEISRRSFLNDAVKAGAAMSAFTIVPRHVLGRGYTPPSALLNIAVVGCGGMGAGNAEAVAMENLVAFCDVDPLYMQRQVMGDGRETRAPSA